jgi:hypothetical protein
MCVGRHSWFLPCPTCYDWLPTTHNTRVISCWTRLMFPCSVWLDSVNIDSALILKVLHSKSSAVHGPISAYHILTCFSHIPTDIWASWDQGIVSSVSQTSVTLHSFTSRIVCFYIWHVFKFRDWARQKIYNCEYLWPPLRSSGQSSWLQIRRPGFDSWHYQKKKLVGLERGPLSLVSTIEELLDRKVAAPV